MKVTIRTFGPLCAHLPVQQLSLEGNCTLKELNLLLQQQFPSIQQFPYIFAINKQIITDPDVALNHGDEIALLPPFSGG
jgi:molybdopterin converting factor small subunit